MEEDQANIALLKETLDKSAQKVSNVRRQGVDFMKLPVDVDVGLYKFAANESW